MPTNCKQCWENYDGFIRDIVRIEIFDFETSIQIRQDGLQRRIAAKVRKKDIFKPICCLCLEDQLDDELSGFIMRTVEQEGASQ